MNVFVLANAICDTEEQTAKVTDILKKKFGCYVNPMQNGICIDICLAEVDKATGISRFADCLGIPYENIWKAGDNFNDMNMLEKFHGFAMTNGVEDISSTAKLQIFTYILYT